MNSNYKHSSIHQREPSFSLGPLQTACQRCSQLIARRLAKVRNAVERQFASKMAGYERALKSAINEAEALAWQTPYPHLFFPVLAEEKAAAAGQWVTRQRAVQRGNPVHLLWRLQ